MKRDNIAVRILRLVLPWWKWVIAATVSMVLFALLSGVTLGMLLPLFDDILLPQQGRHDVNQDFLESFDRNCSESLSEFGRSLIRFDYENTKEHGGTLADGLSETLRESNPSQVLFAVILFIVLTIFLKNLFGFFQRYFISKAEHEVIAGLRNSLYKHILELDMGFYSSTRTGDIIAKFTSDVTRMNKCMTQMLMKVPRHTVLLVVYLTLALWASWRLAIATLLIFPPIMFVILIIGRILKKKTRYAQKRLSDFSSILHETIFGIRVIKAFSMEGYEKDKFRHVIDIHKNTRISIRRIKALASPITEFMGAVATGAIMWYGGQAVLSGETLTTGRFLVFIAAVLSMMKPIKMLGNANAAIQSGFASAERVFALMDTRALVEEVENPKRLGPIASGIEFKDVCFSYKEGIEVLHRISFSIKKGEIVALVGPSGGGKSTIADLIPRFYDPDSGSITIDGIDLREIRLEDIRRSLGVVTQETILFNDTILNNIAYGVEDVPLETIRKAAEAANALEFIEELPDGFETVIGERGSQLSGGQKQRLAIARAILKNPEILIFDEATSALDTHSERYVQHAIDNLIEGRTTLVIAHRLSTITKATRIIYIDNGRIVEQGIHDDLLALNGRYRELYDMQFNNE